MYLLLFGAFLVAWFGLADPPLTLMLGPACAWMGGANVFLGEAAVLSEEGSPLLSAWLRVAWLAATVLGTVAFASLAHVWLGWAGVAGALILLAVGLAIDAYRGDPGAPNQSGRNAGGARE